VHLVLVLLPQQLLPLVFGGGGDSGDDDAFLSSIFFRPSPFLIVIVFSGTESRSRENHRF
jgi:hypothetical protein